MKVETKILLGDCQDKLKEIPDDSIDLIFTSPSIYADHRKTVFPK